MKSHILPVFLFLVLILSAPLFSQTAAKLEALLEIPALTWSEAAAFVLEAADTEISGIEPPPAELAFRFAEEKKWLPKNTSPGDTVRLNGLALLLMRSFDLKGGIFYSLTKSPHHAYRELVYKNIIRGNTDPGIPVSGQDLLLMINRLLAIKEQS